MRGARRVQVVTGLLIVAALAIAAAGWAYLRSEAWQARAEGYVVAQIEQATGTRVQVGHFDLTLRPLRISLAGVTLTRGDGSTLATVDRIAADASLLSLRHRQVRIDRLQLERPHVAIDISSPGGASLPLPTLNSARLLDMKIGALDVNQGELRLGDRLIPFDVHLSAIALHARRAGAGLAGALSFEKSALQYRGVALADARADLRFQLLPAAILIDDLHLSAIGAEINARGRLDDFQRPRLTFSAITVSASLAQRDHRFTSGQIVLQGHATASSDAMAATGQLALNDVRLRAQPAVAWRGESHFEANSDGLSLPNLTLYGLGGRFEAAAQLRHWHELSARGAMASLQLAALRTIVPIPPVAAQWLPLMDARVNGTFQVAGSIEQWQTASVSATIASGSGTKPPVSGHIPVSGTVKASFTPDQITLRQLALAADGATLQATGTLGAHSSHLQMSAAAPDASALPGHPFSGSAEFHGTVGGPISAPTMAGTFHSQHFRYQRFAIDDVTLAGSISPERLHLDHAALRQGGQRISISGDLALADYLPNASSHFDLALRGDHLSVDEVKAWAGRSYPLTGGILDVQATLAGTPEHPTGRGQWQLRQTHWQQQPIQAMSASFRLEDDVLTSSDFALLLPRTRVSGSLRLGLADHSYTFDMASPAVQLADIAPLQSPRLAMSGLVRFQLTGSGRWEQPRATLILTTTGLRGGGESLGDVGARAQLDQGRIHFQIADVLTNGNFNITGVANAIAPYAAQAHLDLRDYDFDAWLRRFTPADLTGHSRISGTADLDGPLAQPERINARIALNPVELAVSGLVLRNLTPILLTTERGGLTLAPAHIASSDAAHDTDLTLNGSITPHLLSSPAIAGRLQGTVNLALIESLHPSTRASGHLAIAATLAGTLDQPLLAGSVAIHDASLAEENLPIAFDHIEGQLSLRGNRAQIDHLTADTGSGSVAITGFANRLAGVTNFDFAATGVNLRLRYQGISATGDLRLRLNGSSLEHADNQNATLTGAAQLNRIGLDQNFDLALFIAGMQTPPSLPDSGSILNRIGLDVHLITGPQLQVATNLARLSIQADLRLRGTLANPAVLGRASASDGRLLFGGNQYQVTKAQVQFVNPFKIEPILDIGLTTTVQQYDVTLNLVGPADKLAINYRSDPPLSSSDVVALLATGQPTQAASTLAGGGSNSFSGSEQLLGQALNNVVAGRLQRLFGVTQVQINPNSGPLGTTGSGGTVTIQQQVARNLKLTYTQNLASSSQDIIQIDWTISRYLGITLDRDQFGLYGLKFTFRHRAR
ncbi:MAG TPA: translocation/assembly module TamB domain-containing protein [Terriglobales bacterium]|nr:translocation/assembly module TamB domain-containing protein [Terriglobales bacterium]